MDEPSSKEGFGVDHYRPVKLFKSLERVYTNLFYSCARCNSRKKTYWPPSSLEATHFIPNPCDHVMSAHLKYDDAVVTSRSDAGEVAVETMDLNGEEIVEYRQHYLRKVRLFRADLERNTKRLSKLQRTLRAETKPPRIAALTTAIAKVEQTLKDTTSDLERLGVSI